MGGKEEGGKEEGGEKVGGKEVGGKEIGGKEVGGKEVGGKEGFASDAGGGVWPSAAGAAGGKKQIDAEGSTENRAAVESTEIGPADSTAGFLGSTETNAAGSTEIGPADLNETRSVDSTEIWSLACDCVRRVELLYTLNSLQAEAALTPPDTQATPQRPAAVPFSPNQASSHRSPAHSPPTPSAPAASRRPTALPSPAARLPPPATWEAEPPLLSPPPHLELCVEIPLSHLRLLISATADVARRNTWVLSDGREVKGGGGARGAGELIGDDFESVVGRKSGGGDSVLGGDKARGGSAAPAGQPIPGGEVRPPILAGGPAPTVGWAARSVAALAPALPDLAELGITWGDETVSVEVGEEAVGEWRRKLREEGGHEEEQGEEGREARSRTMEEEGEKVEGWEGHWQEVGDGLAAEATAGGGGAATPAKASPMCLHAGGAAADSGLPIPPGGTAMAGSCIPPGGGVASRPCYGDAGARRLAAKLALLLSRLPLRAFRPLRCASDGTDGRELKDGTVCEDQMGWEDETGLEDGIGLDDEAGWDDGIGLDDGTDGANCPSAHAGAAAGGRATAAGLWGTAGGASLRSVPLSMPRLRSVPWLALERLLEREAAEAAATGNDALEAQAVECLDELRDLAADDIEGEDGDGEYEGEAEDTEREREDTEGEGVDAKGEGGDAEGEGGDADGEEDTEAGKETVGRGARGRSTLGSPPLTPPLPRWLFLLRRDLTHEEARLGEKLLSGRKEWRALSGRAAAAAAGCAWLLAEEQSLTRSYWLAQLSVFLPSVSSAGPPSPPVSSTALSPVPSNAPPPVPSGGPPPVSSAKPAAAAAPARPRTSATWPGGPSPPPVSPPPTAGGRFSTPAAAAAAAASLAAEAFPFFGAFGAPAPPPPPPPPAKPDPFTDAPTKAEPFVECFRESPAQAELFMGASASTALFMEADVDGDAPPPPRARPPPPPPVSPPPAVHPTASSPAPSPPAVHPTANTPGQGVVGGGAEAGTVGGRGSAGSCGEADSAHGKSVPFTAGPFTADEADGTRASAAAAMEV
jgi:hypothetical protein